MALLAGVMLVTITALIVPARAERELRWYWAWREADGAVLAYTAFGDVNVLITDARAYRLRRVDDSSAVVIIEQQNYFAYYYLTPTSAHEIMPLGPYESGPVAVAFVNYPLINGQAMLLNLDYPHLFIADSDIGTGKRFIYNRETLQVEDVTVPAFTEICASEDGTKLRYAYPTRTVENVYHASMKVEELDVVSGNARMLAEFRAAERDRYDEEYIQCVATQYGDFWHCTEHVSGYLPVENAWVMRADGTLYTVPVDFYFREGFDGNAYFIASENYLLGCAEGCEAHLYSIDL
ncbi:MAG: hypothetical protein AAFR22_17685, partial [Chloroflexota bacterium]